MTIRQLLGQVLEGILGYFCLALCCNQVNKNQRILTKFIWANGLIAAFQKSTEASWRKDGLPLLCKKTLVVKGAMLTFVHRGSSLTSVPANGLCLTPCNLNKSPCSTSGKVRECMEAPTISKLTWALNGYTLPHGFTFLSFGWPQGLRTDWICILCLCF